MARANPERTLESILNAKDRTEAIERLTAALRRTWQAGYHIGWRDGVSDASDDDSTTHDNPYRQEDR